ncbi:MAG: PD-(D/E)XK nuclease family protein [Actinomycetota bacterium]|jgi:putative RecB family exonuclease|nr:PD-(D/E)XK nuclease family protein [Actinomycetota bacterium]
MPFAPPRSLSPSKVSAFTDCPLAFRLSVIDRLPEPPSPAAVKGTLVHAALERLIWNHPPGGRTLDTARHELDAAWAALGDQPDFLLLGLSDTDAESFRADAAVLIESYFTLEDPNGVDALGVELGMEVQIGQMRLRGVIDRLDRGATGELVVIDYKTGRSPSARFEQARLGGVHIYALLCRHLLGRAPAEVRLLYLRDRVTIVAKPSDQSVQGQIGRTTAVWSAIERACSHEDFRPRRSPLCRFCHFQDLCPQFGGQPPAGPRI